jgi:hypothetical protein
MPLEGSYAQLRFMADDAADSGDACDVVPNESQSATSDVAFSDAEYEACLKVQ